MAARLVRRGGAANPPPEGILPQIHSKHVEGPALIHMLREHFVAQRIAMDSRRDLIAYMRQDDTTTGRMLEAILATEEEHAEDMATLLQQLG